jgi:glycosyltransferase involved in cell wall biosynthesis
VAFVPVLEDFGLVTLEAFLSGKPVITCADAGEPARIVRDRESGYVCAPDERQIARRIEALWHDRALARSMGEVGRRSISGVSWGATARRLLDATGVR